MARYRRARYWSQGDQRWERARRGRRGGYTPKTKTPQGRARVRERGLWSYDLVTDPLHPNERRLREQYRLIDEYVSRKTSEAKKKRRRPIQARIYMYVYTRAYGQSKGKRSIISTEYFDVENKDALAQRVAQELVAHSHPPLGHRPAAIAKITFSK